MIVWLLNNRFTCKKYVLTACFSTIVHLLMVSITSKLGKYAFFPISKILSSIPLFFWNPHIWKNTHYLILIYFIEFLVNIRNHGKKLQDLRGQRQLKSWKAMDILHIMICFTHFTVMRLNVFKKYIHFLNNINIDFSYALITLKNHSHTKISIHIHLVCANVSFL